MCCTSPARDSGTEIQNEMFRLTYNPSNEKIFKYRVFQSTCIEMKSWCTFYVTNLYTKNVNNLFISKYGHTLKVDRMSFPRDLYTKNRLSYNCF